jgi:hypothetical protein
MTMAEGQAMTARVFIGFDSKEVVAYHVLVQSILDHASIPVTFTPIALSTLSGVFRRERNQLQSTEFSFSRFLVPYLSGFEGWSLFCDCDMLFRADIAELWSLRDESFSVLCCKHDYQPKEDIKFLGQVQTKYEKKNWSSVMLFNNARCRALSAEYVNSATGLELHQFKWLGDDSLIGELPPRWNHLVGYSAPSRDVSLVHFTLGGPYFDEYRDCEFAPAWRAELDAMQRAEQRAGKRTAA